MFSKKETKTQIGFYLIGISSHSIDSIDGFIINVAAEEFVTQFPDVSLYVEKAKNDKGRHSTRTHRRPSRKATQTKAKANMNAFSLSFYPRFFVSFLAGKKPLEQSWRTLKKCTANNSLNWVK